MKALLPRYAGKVDVIYIDPPYNTGNEGWAYNDNVNSPLMKEWLGKIVDGDDLERHDKWLCMMWPRLSLLHELLHDEGVFFCSIDDNEMHNLRAILDAIFGQKNFLAQVSVLVNPKGRGMKDSDFAKSHEYVVCYQKAKRSNELGIRKSDEQVATEYKYKDENGVAFRLLELRNTHREFGKHNRENLWFPIYAESVSDKELGHVSVEAKKGYEKVFPRWDDGYEGCWTWDQAKVEKDIDLLRVRFVEGRQKIFRISYSKDASGKSVKQKAKTIWTDKLFFTEQGKTDLGLILPKAQFPNPKPVALIEHLLSLLDNDQFVVLDSFAGSGTTAEAVLRLNYEDGGSRKFILVETEDYVNTVTAERARKVISGVPKAEKRDLKAGLGGSFTFCDLGDALDLERFFDGKGAPSYEQVARYVVYTATGHSIPDAPTEARKDWFVGELGGYRIHLIYKPDLDFMRSNDAALSMPLADQIAKSAKGKPVLVYAAAKFMSQNELTKKGITFCQLPYSVHRVLGEAADA